MLVLRCFGSVAVVDEEERDLALRSRKHLALLLYISSHPRTFFSRDELANLLWHGNDSRARHSLSQALYDIRATLGSILHATNVGVQLRRHTLNSEGTQFCKAVERKNYQVAMKLYRGPFAPDLANLGARDWDRWLEGERDRFQVLAGMTARSHLQDAEMRGDWDAVCRTALRMLRTNDLDEVAHRTLMRGLWMKGDAPSALDHFEQAAARLDRRLHDPFSEQTRNLATIIRRSVRGDNSWLPLDPQIGRQALLASVWRDLKHGPESVALLGERGMGKSLFRNHLAVLAASYGTTVHNIRGAAGRWQAANEPGTGRDWRRLLDATDDASQSASPILLVIDDAQDVPADDARSLIARLRRTKVSLLITVDLDSMWTVPRPALVAYVQEEKGACIELPAMTEAEMAALLRSRWGNLPADAMRSVICQAGGNPLYGLELARHLARRRAIDFDCVGLRRLRSLFDERLSALDPFCRKIFHVIVALRRGASEPVVTALAGKESDCNGAIKRLIRGRFIERGDADGWVARVPLLERYIQDEMGVSQYAALNLAAAQLCRSAPGSNRLAVALHLAEAGEGKQAHWEALRAVDAAVEDGRVADAARAAGVAAQHAVSMRDRLQARVQQGQMEFVRGSYREAERILLPLVVDGGLEVEEGTTLRLSLAIIALKLGRIGEARDWRNEVRCGLDEVSSEREALLSRLTALEFQLAALSDPGSLSSLLDELKTRLSSLEPRTAQAWLGWCEAWQVYLPYLLDSVALAAAKAAVTRYATVLSRVPARWGPVGLASRGLVAIREGHLDLAAGLYSQAIEKLPDEAPTRLHSLLVNNLAVSHLEQGQFPKAMELLERCKELDRALSAPPADAAIPLLNLASRSLYEGRPDEGEAVCRRLLKSLNVAEHRGLHDETTACMGLLAVAAGKRVSLGWTTDMLHGDPMCPGFGCDRLKPIWLRGFVKATRDLNESIDPGSCVA